MRRFVCWLFGHRYYIEREINFTSRKLGCARCGMMFAMNDDVHCLLPWDDDFENLSKWVEEMRKQS